MEITRKKININYAPLNVAVSLSCLSSGSPLTQVFDAANGEYEPDRELTPTLIKPTIVANASDGSLGTAYGNASLADMKWYVDGVAIEESAFAGYYEVTTSGEDRGTISISMNVPVNTRYQLHFEAVIADTRLGVNIPIKTDAIVLMTTDASEDSYSLSIAEDQAIQYNPFEDNLLAYDYEVAHGLVTASASAEETATDANCYLRSIPVTLHLGDEEVDADGYEVSVFSVDGTTLTEVTASDDNEFNEISSTEIVMDLRLVEKADYVVRAYVDGEQVAQIQYSVGRIYPSYRIETKNGADFTASDVTRYDEAMVSSNGNIVENPGNLILMKWYTDTSTITEQEHNEGYRCAYDIASTGIGKTSSTNWVEQYIVSEHKGIYSVAVDVDGNYLTDGDGNQYIFN